MRDGSIAPRQSGEKKSETLNPRMLERRRLKKSLDKELTICIMVED